MLCDKCTNIHFRRIKDCKPIKQNPERLNGPQGPIRISGPVFYFHHESKNALQASAENGCHFCEMIFHSLFQTFTTIGGDYPFARGEVILRRSVPEIWRKHDNIQKWNTSDWVFINCENKMAVTTSLSFEGDMAAMLKALTFCRNLNVAPLIPEVATGKVSTVSTDDLRADSAYLLADKSPELYSPWLDVSTMSLASLSLASMWLKNCLQNHQPCKELQTLGTLPTRVINIEDPQSPHLEDGYQRRDEYLTLSYKWGTNRRYTTTSKNLDAHRRLLPLERLPMTFRDAMYVAYMLGFRWLWIDALCILQDSKEDQEREMGNMNQIFRSSTLTLFAAAGNSVDAGLSSARDPRWVKPCLLTLRTTLDGQVVEGSSYISIDGHRPSEPLYSRGWVLQEEILSARGLIFGSCELIWRCLCTHALESRPDYRDKVDTLTELGSEQDDKRRHYSLSYDGFNPLRMWIMKIHPVPDRAPWQRDIYFDHWYSLVVDFSHRKLTYTSDILPALSGISSALAKVHGCTYLSGLWKEDLQIGLIWYVACDRAYRSRCPPNDQKESETPDLPSWSWISRFGEVIDFRRWENNNRQVIHEGLSLAADLDDSRAFSANPFGHVTTRRLSLTGRLRIAMVEHVSTDSFVRRDTDKLDSEDARFTQIVKDPKSGETIGLIALDSDPGNDALGLVHCLLCTVREKYGKWQLTCLGLKPTDQTCEDFTRVGLVFLHEKDWFGTLNDFYEPGRGRQNTRYVRTVCVL